MVIVTGVWNLSTSNTHHEKSMPATGILICHDNSHPFQERTLSLESPIKIGRSVARARAAVDNAIFDCKVLSRNHAILWYESGKFYLKDTKSSNGTFVNNKRLSPSGEESSPFEVSSGDIVQFGVDVVDSTKKVTHGCIVASLKLYLPDGKEAKNNSTNSAIYINITMEDLYKLNQSIQEAGRRENALRSKLEYMQQLLDYTRISVKQSWKSLIMEDCLISRLEMLENQVAAYSKSFGEDELKIELLKLIEDKLQYQNATKALLQSKVHEQRDFVAKFQILKFKLSETEKNTQRLHGILKDTQAELQELAIKYVDAQQNLQDASEKLDRNKDKLEEILKGANNERQDLLRKFENQELMKINLETELQSSRLDAINIRKQITALQSYLLTLHDLGKLTNQSLDITNTLLSSETSMVSESTWDTNYMTISNEKTWLTGLRCRKTQRKWDSNERSNGSHRENHTAHTKFGLDDGYDSNYFSLSTNTSPWICNKGQFLTTNQIKPVDVSQEASADYSHSEIPNLITYFQSNEMSTYTSILRKDDKIANQLDTPFVKCLMNFLRHGSMSNFERNLYHLDISKSVEGLLMSLTNPIQYDATANNEEHSNFLCYNLNHREVCPNDSPEYVTTVSLKNHVTPISYSMGKLQQDMLQILDIFDIVNKDFEEISVSKQNSSVLRSNQDVDAAYMSKFDHYIAAMQKIATIQELSEQLVIMKERYNAIIEEKSSLLKKYLELQTRSNSPANTEIIMGSYSILPVLILLIWIMLKYFSQMIDSLV